MRHTTLTAIMLVAFGLMPSFGMLGGGTVYFDKGDDSAIQQSASLTDQTGTKRTAGQKTADNQPAMPCKNNQESACSGYTARPVK